MLHFSAAGVINVVMMTTVTIAVSPRPSRIGVCAIWSVLPSVGHNSATSPL